FIVPREKHPKKAGIDEGEVFPGQHGRAEQESGKEYTVFKQAKQREQAKADPDKIIHDRPNKIETAKRGRTTENEGQPDWLPFCNAFRLKVPKSSEQTEEDA